MQDFNRLDERRLSWRKIKSIRTKAERQDYGGGDRERKKEGGRVEER